MKGADHFSFNNRLTDTLFSAFFGEDEGRFAVIRSRSVAFPERYVAGRKAGVEIGRPDPLLTRVLSDPPERAGALPN